MTSFGALPSAEEPVRVLQGDALSMLSTLPDECVQCCVTSPPYFGLRDNNTGRWEGGDPTCAHGVRRWDGPKQTQGAMSGHAAAADRLDRRACPCGAVRVDEQIGLEETPELFIERLVAVFRELRRVLRPDGTFWLNMGDGYANDTKWGGSGGGPTSKNYTSGLGGCQGQKARRHTGLKPKDLLMMPHRLALALQQPYMVPHLIKRECDRAWLAAFMDGEGCLSIRQQEGLSQSGGQCQDGFVPFLCASNNDRELLDHCQAITARGRVGVKQAAGKDSRGIESRRDNYGWRVESLACVDIITDIYPFLIAKRKQAVLIYNLALSNRNGRELRGNGRLPEAEQQKRAYLKELVNRCNQREPVDIPSWCEEPHQQVEPGWWVRMDGVWEKPNPMPESVRDRPTRAHEYVFLLTKAAQYYYDATAVREQAVAGHAAGNGYRRSEGLSRGVRGDLAADTAVRAFRNQRSVWTINTRSYAGAHFSTFPPALVTPCVKAGTSERGACGTCGAPWRRLTQRETVLCGNSARAGRTPAEINATGKWAGVREGNKNVKSGPVLSVETTGWTPTCAHADPPRPCVILDPFAGSGTTGAVALELGRHAILIELQESYLPLIQSRLAKVQVKANFDD